MTHMIRVQYRKHSRDNKAEIAIYQEMGLAISRVSRRSRGRSYEIDEGDLLLLRLKYPLLDRVIERV